MKLKLYKLLITNFRPSSPRSVAERGIRAAHTLYPAISRTETLRDDVSGMTKCVARGFTLIELLVVVLIIGILAAVAVPQYQKAVMRSRYATLKHLVKSITDAQEVFYLANGQYAGKFEMLDVQIPEPLTKNEDDNQYTFPWGLCRMVVREPTPSKPADVFVKCQNDLIHMGYQIYPTHAPANKTVGTVCVIHDVGIDSLQAQICKQETGKEENDSSGTGWIAWFY